MTTLGVWFWSVTIQTENQFLQFSAKYQKGTNLPTHTDVYIHEKAISFRELCLELVNYDNGLLCFSMLVVWLWFVTIQTQVFWISVFAVFGQYLINQSPVIFYFHLKSQTRYSAITYRIIETVGCQKSKCSSSWPPITTFTWIVNIQTLIPAFTQTHSKPTTQTSKKPK